MLHWGLYLVGRKQEPWIIAPEVMSLTGYVWKMFLSKETFHLWDCMADMWKKVIEYHMGNM